MFFYGLAALFGAILNTKERFAANAWAPVVNNLVVIAVAVVLWSGNFRKGEMTTPELLILGVGTTLGIVLQAVVMIPSLVRSGFRFRWRWGWDPRLSEAGGLIGWAIVYVLISQVGVVVTTNVANGHDVGGPTTFSYASLLFQMPYGILGVAVLTAIMPRLSGMRRPGSWRRSRTTSHSPTGCPPSRCCRCPPRSWCWGAASRWRCSGTRT